MREIFKKLSNRMVGEVVVIAEAMVAWSPVMILWTDLRSLWMKLPMSALVKSLSVSFPK